MDPVVSVHNKNFSREPEELYEVPEPTSKSKDIHTDNSLEFGKSCEELSWNHCTSTPQRAETNGIAERGVRRVKRGYVCGTVAVWSG